MIAKCKTMQLVPNDDGILMVWSIKGSSGMLSSGAGSVNGTPSFIAVFCNTQHAKITWHALSGSAEQLVSSYVKAHPPGLQNLYSTTTWMHVWHLLYECSSLLCELEHNLNHQEKMNEMKIVCMEIINSWFTNKPTISVGILCKMHPKHTILQHEVLVRTLRQRHLAGCILHLM